MTERELLIFDDADSLAARAADIVVHTARDAIAQRGRFTFVLSGGSTPEKTYDLLAKHNPTFDIDWTKTYLFFGDERFVPHDDPRSNSRLVDKALLSKIPIPPSNVFAIQTRTSTVEEAAAEYSKTLADFFSSVGSKSPPCFDLIFLGLGSDGHTASLFPHSVALNVKDTWATSSPAGILPPAVDRITLTYPAINTARRIVFLVSGENKSTVLKDILEEDANVKQLPAAGIRPVNGSLTWLADKQAAKLLTKGL